MRNLPERSEILLPLLLLLLLASCSSQTDRKEKSPPVRVILDTDMGSDCDDAGALAILHQYALMGKAEILACIYSSEKIPFGVGVIDALNTHYGSPDLPIGASQGKQVGDPVDKMLAEQLAMDTARYGHDVISSRDVPDQTALSRKILARQEDQSVTYITIGHTKGLYELLNSGPDMNSPLSGRELVLRKVQRWVALGGLGANNPEGIYRQDWNFFRNGTAPYTEYLVKQFPRPIYFVHSGSDVMTGRSLRQLPEGNILRDTYSTWLWNYSQSSLEDQRPSWDLATIYYAIEGCGSFLEEESPGWLFLDAEKGCRWEQGENDMQHTYIKQKEGVADEFAAYLNELLIK